MAKFRYIGRGSNRIKVSTRKTPQQIADQLNKMWDNADRLDQRDSERGVRIEAHEPLRMDAMLDMDDAALGNWGKRNGIRQREDGTFYVDEKIAARAAKGSVGG